MKRVQVLSLRKEGRREREGWQTEQNVRSTHTHTRTHLHINSVGYSGGGLNCLIDSSNVWLAGWLAPLMFMEHSFIGLL